MALAAMASSASILPCTSIPSTSDTMFSSHLNMNHSFQSNTGLNNGFSNNNAAEISYAKIENIPCSSMTSSIRSQTSYLNTQLNDGHGTTTSALKAALQFSTSPSDIKSSSPKPLLQ